MKVEINWQDFEKVEMRVGTIIEVNDFPEARNPAYQLKIDFGKEIGLLNNKALFKRRFTQQTNCCGCEFS